MFKYTKTNTGQSTVEYIILVTAVIAVIILFVANQKGGFQEYLNNLTGTAANRIYEKSFTLQNTYQSPKNPAQDAGFGVPKQLGVNPNQKTTP